MVISGNQVDLFPLILPHIPDLQVACHTVSILFLAQSEFIFPSLFLKGDLTKTLLKRLDLKELCW